MGFWIFMLVMVLLIPVIMLIFGRQFIKAAPRRINPAFGYRTAMSMKNRDTWEFAHKCIGQLWLYGGLALLPVSVVPMLFVTGKSVDVIGYVGLAVTMLGVLVMCLSIIPVEAALKRNFDKNGIRKS